MTAKFGVFADDDYCKFPSLYWLPKIHKRPYKSLLVHVQLPSCLFFCILASLRLKTMPLNIEQLFMKRMVKHFWSINNSGEILNKLNLEDF